MTAELPSNPPDPGSAAPPQLPPPAQPPLIRIDLTAWPQVRAEVPATVPVGLAIAALESVLAQLRQFHIEQEIQRRAAPQG